MLPDKTSLPTTVQNLDSEMNKQNEPQFIIAALILLYIIYCTRVLVDGYVALKQADPLDQLADTCAQISLLP